MVVELATERVRRAGGWDPPEPIPESAFELRGDAIEKTLRRACEGGRCHVRRNDGERPTAPLRWDDGPPWQFRLGVSREDNDRYEITGAFHRADGVDFGVWRTGLLVKPLADDLSAAHEHRADARIGKRESGSLRGQFQRAFQETAVSARRNS